MHLLPAINSATCVRCSPSRRTCAPVHRTCATCREFTSRGVRAYCVRGYHVVAINRAWLRDGDSIARPRYAAIRLVIALRCIALQHRVAPRHLEGAASHNRANFSMLVLISAISQRSKRISKVLFRERELPRREFITGRLIKKKNFTPLQSITNDLR